MENKRRKFLLLAEFLILLVVVLGMVFWVGKPQILKKKAGLATVVLSLEAKGKRTKVGGAITKVTVARNEEVAVGVFLTTGGETVKGVDLKLDFVPQEAELVAVRPNEAAGWGIFLPITGVMGSFDETKVVEEARQGGVISFGALAFNKNGSAGDYLAEGVKGEVKVADLVFKFLPTGSGAQKTVVSFVFSGGETDFLDCNVLRDGEDVLGVALGLEFDLEVLPTSTPRPTNTPVPVVTVKPTGAVVVTGSVSRPTVAPTLMPTPVLGVPVPKISCNSAKPTASVTWPNVGTTTYEVKWAVPRSCPEGQFCILSMDQKSAAVVCETQLCNYVISDPVASEVYVVATRDKVIKKSTSGLSFNCVVLQ